MILHTERLTLRPFQMSDLHTTHEYASDGEYTKYMIYLPNNTIEETEQFLRRVVYEWEKDTPQIYEFAVILNGKHIGAVSVWLDDERTVAELGWIIRKEYTGRGYATEAAKAVLDFAMETLRVRKVIAHCDYRNAASSKVMQKIGLTLEREDGVRRYKGSDEDIKEWMYSFVRHE